MKLPELKYTTPQQFTRKQHLKLALLPPIATALLKFLFFTCRIEVRHEDYLRDTLASGGHAIIALWHESIPYTLYRHRNSNYHVASSYSFDGELAARLTRGFKLECLRGSTSRGGTDLLRQLEKALELVECVGLTMDGPRGPRRQAQLGLAILSARTGVPVIPLAFSINRRWRLRTWDRMPIPKPFATVLFEYGPPIQPAEKVKRALIEDKRREMQDSLNRIHEALEAESGDVQHELLREPDAGA